MNKVSQEQFANNALWKFFEIIIRKIVSLIISTIIARLVAPEAYGVVALTTVFITFSDIFILNGFNIAIVRKDKVDQEDYSTVMILSLVFSAIVYSIIFISAPLLSTFYNSPELKNVLRVITILIFFQSVATVIRSHATRELQFKKMSLVAIVNSTLSSIVALILAYKQFGVWALVTQQVLSNFLDMILLSIVFKWKYTLKYSAKKVKEMIKFTMGVLSASFLDFLGNNANNLVIGRAYNATELGFYNRGNVYPETISLNTYNSINSVLLPTLATRQKDKKEMKKVVRKVVSLTEFIILPMMVGLAGVSDNFVRVLLTDKWECCIPVLICACLNYAINPIRSIGYNVFYARGESNRSVKIETVRSIVMILNLVVTIILLRQSIYVLAATGVAISLLVAGITQFQVKKCIDYRYSELFMDILPTSIMCLVMLVIIRLVVLLPFNNSILFIIQIVLGLLSYWLMSVVTKNRNYIFLKDYVMKKLHRKQSHE